MTFVFVYSYISYFHNFKLFASIIAFFIGEFLLIWPHFFLFPKILVNISHAFFNGFYSTLNFSSIISMIFLYSSVYLKYVPHRWLAQSNLIDVVDDYYVLCLFFFSTFPYLFSKKINFSFVTIKLVSLTVVILSIFIKPLNFHTNFLILFQIILFLLFSILFFISYFKSRIYFNFLHLVSPFFIVLLDYNFVFNSLLAIRFLTYSRHSPQKSIHFGLLCSFLTFLLMTMKISLHFSNILTVSLIVILIVDVTPRFLILSKLFLALVVTSKTFFLILISSIFFPITFSSLIICSIINIPVIPVFNLPIFLPSLSVYSVNRTRDTSSAHKDDVIQENSLDFTNLLYSWSNEISVSRDFKNWLKNQLTFVDQFFILFEPSSGLIFLKFCNDFNFEPNIWSIGLELSDITSCHAVEATILHDTLTGKGSKRSPKCVKNHGKLRTNVLTAQNHSIYGVIDRKDFVSAFNTSISPFIDFLGLDTSAPTVDSMDDVINLINNFEPISEAAGLCFLYCYQSFLIDDVIQRPSASEVSSLFAKWGVTFSQNLPNYLPVIKSQAVSLFVLSLSSDNSINKITIIKKEEVELLVASMDSIIFDSLVTWQGLDLLFFGNDDEERFSVQSHPLLFRNMLLQAGPSPVGYSPYEELLR
ncbi:hypothetical protein RCL1_005682 [Eukaryota sp. TZLM3-RCL]